MLIYYKLKQKQLKILMFFNNKELLLDFLTSTQ
jgi:hypothetical protein